MTLSEDINISLKRGRKMIKELEQKTGLVLIDWNKDKVILTPEGQKYYEDIVNIIGQSKAGYTMLWSDTTL